MTDPRLLDDEDFLAGIRSGEWERWNLEYFDQELRNPKRIDSVRRLVVASDKLLILMHLASDRVRETLIAHMLGRALIVSGDQEVKKAFEAAYRRWEAKEDLLLIVCLFHDLAEDDVFIGRHGDAYIELVRQQPRGVRQVLANFAHADHDFFELFSRRLRDVFGPQQTMNSPAKAFMYALYLGLVEDHGLVARVRAVLEEFKDVGDERYRSVNAAVRASLPA